MTLNAFSIANICSKSTQIISRQTFESFIVNKNIKTTVNQRTDKEKLISAYFFYSNIMPIQEKCIFLKLKHTFHTHTHTNTLKTRPFFPVIKCQVYL